MKKQPPPVILPPEVPLVPRWVIPSAPAGGRTDAAFMAGAALEVLDRLVRQQQEWAGAWRQRQALSCGVIAVRLAGRTEEEAELRDAWLLRSAGDDPGPAGNILGAWKRLGSRHQSITTPVVREIATLCGIGWSNVLEDVAPLFDELLQLRAPPPFVAASVISAVHRLRPDAPLLGLWLADVALAERLQWPVAVPLLMGQRLGPAFRAPGGRKVIRPDEEGFDTAICVAYSHAAADACRLAADIARRAARLTEVSPRLRSKGAGELLDLLFAEDAVAGTYQSDSLSRWASRRLFERLLELEAVRELSGRDTFRIFGL